MILAWKAACEDLLEINQIIAQIIARKRTYQLVGFKAKLFVEIMQMKIRTLIIQHKSETGLQILHQTHTKKIICCTDAIKCNWMFRIFYLLNLATLSWNRGACRHSSFELAFG